MLFAYAFLGHPCTVVSFVETLVVGVGAAERICSLNFDD